jgi:hypothetical protein
MILFIVKMHRVWLQEKGIREPLWESDRMIGDNGAGMGMEVTQSGIEKSGARRHAWFPFGMMGV